LTKVIVSAASADINAAVDPRFGRGAYLILVDTQTLEWQSFENPGVQASGGAGIQAAQFIAKQNVEAVISGDFGPNAHEALAAANVKMYVFNNQATTVQAAIDDFKAEKLQAVHAPTRAGEHGR
jgi:predicted Fe-Mo cluster-binding NifX family protein